MGAGLGRVLVARLRTIWDIVLSQIAALHQSSETAFSAISTRSHPSANSTLANLTESFHLMPHPGMPPYCVNEKV